LALTFYESKTIQVRRSNNNVVEYVMLDRRVEIFCDFDDFCKSAKTQWEALLLTNGGRLERKYGPECGLCDSEIMTLLVLYHTSRFKNFKAFYNGVVLGMLRSYFPEAPCYERFLTLTKRVWALLAFFLASRMGEKTGICYIDSTPLAVCHNRRINRHKVFDGLAARGKTSTGWFFGFKLHLVFNHRREIIALKPTPGNVSDTAPRLRCRNLPKIWWENCSATKVILAANWLTNSCGAVLP
jgi:hypothetical protein